MLSVRKHLIHFLLSRGLLENRLVVDGKVLIYDASSRHKNFVVRVRDGDGFFLKQARSTQLDAMEREAACYHLLQNEFPALAELVPRFYCYDKSRNLLILEALPEAENLLLYHSRANSFPVELGTTIGKTLGILHSKAVDHRLSKQPFLGKMPWILLVHTYGPSQFESPSAAKVLEILKRYPDFAERLEGLRDLWRASALIHGDIRFSNMVTHSSAVGLSLKLVDWEFADIGDPLWDVGAVFETYLTFCISAALTSQKTSQENRSYEFYQRMQVKVDQMKPALGAFWIAYMSTVGLDKKRSKGDLDLCICYGAARMLQTVFEATARSHELNQHAIYSLQCSMNILNSPARARSELFGF